MLHRDEVVGQRHKTPLVGGADWLHVYRHLLVRNAIHISQTLGQRSLVIPVAIALIPQLNVIPPGDTQHYKENKFHTHPFR
jgi:hypothetical protein